ncbi:MAG: hypothetical protein DI582_10105 [Azospirillum brasilense]|nr:MAG: hypothetical protein DI582_10105 [Azospirillum brasilense]
MLKNERCAVSSIRGGFIYSRIRKGRNMRAAMMSAFGHFIIVLLRTIGLFLYLLRCLAGIAFTFHFSRMRHRPSKQRKSNKE